MRIWGRTILSAAIIALSASIAGAVVSGQTDDFQAGTVANWTNGGSAAAPTNVSDGGPLGLGDKYMHVVSGSNLATFNTTQWTGNFSAANVLDIALDLRNPNLTDVLDMRVVIFGPSGSRWTSAVPAVVPADNLWHHYVKSLRQADLINVVGGDTYTGTIAGISRMLIRHEVTPSSGGTPFTGAVDIDNISSVVPEPATLALLGALAVSLACRRRRC
jgi:predicted extracellular nuclease